MVVLSREIFQEITLSAGPVDLRAVHLLKDSPLALDINVWLTSYLRRMCLIPGKRQAYRDPCNRLRVCPIWTLSSINASVVA